MKETNAYFYLMESDCGEGSKYRQNEDVGTANEETGCIETSH